MIDKILFRAKPTNSDKWVYGFYVFKPVEDVHLIVSEDTIPYRLTTFLEETKVRPETLQQLHRNWWRGEHYRNCL